MDSTSEAAIATVAAFLVLLSVLWNPGVSALIAVTALSALAIYKLVERRG